ncbi:MAG: DUF4271 domain-containing protein [Paludibacter sp.]|nr:DUF4271 domain-containing protein [Paludibacter sp.]
MPEFQTLNQVTNSLTDTVLVAVDTLRQTASYNWDTLRIAPVVPPVQTGFEGLPLTHSMCNSLWIFAGLLLLMFLPILVFNKSNSFLKDSFSMIFKEKRHQVFRSFHTLSPAAIVLMSIFFVISLSLYISNFVFSEKTDFSYIKLGWILGITTAFVLIKVLINSFLAYVFFDKASVRTVNVNYLNILSLSGFLIFPLLILRIYSVSELYFYIDFATAIILLISILLIILKFFILFYSKFIDLFYILLYLCTLEILPFFILFRVYQIIV